MWSGGLLESFPILFGGVLLVVAIYIEISRGSVLLARTWGRLISHSLWRGLIGMLLS